MPDQPTLDPATRQCQVEREVLYLLTGMRDAQPVWWVPDLGREVDDDEDARLAVRGLHQAGLVHRTSDGFVFAPRAGARIVQLVGHVV